MATRRRLVWQHIEQARKVRSAMWRTEGVDVRSTFRERGWPIDGQMFWRAMVSEMQRKRWTAALAVYDEFASERKRAKTVLERALAPRDDGSLALLRIEALQRLGRWVEAEEGLFADDAEDDFDRISTTILRDPTFAESDKMLVARERLVRKYHVDLTDFSSADVISYLSREKLRCDPKRSDRMTSDAKQSRRSTLFQFQFRHYVYNDDARAPCRRVLPLLEKSFAIGTVISGMTRAGRDKNLAKAEALFRLFKSPPPAAVAALIDARARAARYAFLAARSEQRDALVDGAHALYEAFDPSFHVEKTFKVTIRMLARADRPYAALDVRQSAIAHGKLVHPVAVLDLCRALDCDTALELAIDSLDDDHLAEFMPALVHQCRHAEFQAWRIDFPRAPPPSAKKKMGSTMAGRRPGLVDLLELDDDSVLDHHLDHIRVSSRADLDALLDALLDRRYFRSALQVLQLARRDPPQTW